MGDPRDELTELELMQRGVPRITVRPLEIPAPAPDDTGWGRPGAGGRPSGRLFEPDQSPAPAMGSVAAPASIDPNFTNRYMTTVQEPGQPDRERFELPAARAARDAYATRYTLGGLAAGDNYRPEPTKPWDPDRPRPGLASTQPPAETPLEYATRPITAPLRAAGQLIKGMTTPPQAPLRPVTGGLGPTETSAAEDVEFAKAQQKFAGDTALNLLGAGAPAGYVRPGVSAGMFGSRQSPKADQLAFDLAEGMAAKGMSDQQIFDATKLRRFPDGKFYFEVSDQNARFKGIPDDYDIDKVTQQIFRENNPEQGLDLFGKKTGITAPREGSARYRTEMLKARQAATERIQKKGPLTWSDLYDHPEALEAFPYLRDMPVYIDNEGSWRAAYYPPVTKHERPFMAINPQQNKEASGALAPRGKMLEVGLHEPQHAIDFVEGGARGANVSTNFPPGSPAEGIYKKILEEFAPDMAKMGPAQRQIMEQYARNQAALANYNLSAGENRANLNYLRRDLTQAERDAIDPIKQMKIPSSQQIVEFNEPFAEMGGVLNPVPRDMRMQAKTAATGSKSPFENVDVTWNGKQMREWSPEDWRDVGNYYGIKNLGPLTEPKPYFVKDAQGKPYEFTLPGGIDGEWTYYDLLHMKANPIDPSRIPRDLHIEMQKKLGRTMTENGKEASPQKIWDGLMLGITSPSNPLFPNQLTASRMRLRGDLHNSETINALADSIPWEAGSKVTRDGRPVTKEMIDEYNHSIGRMFDLQSGKADPPGLGTRGSANYTYIAELAQMFRKNPDWFRKTANETWPEFTERLATQTKGLSMKTGSFSGVWQDPYNAAISAIDRHMAREFEKRGGLFPTPADEKAWQQKLIKDWNKERDKVAAAASKKTGQQVEATNKIETFDQLRSMKGSDSFLGEKLLDYVGAHSEPGMRTKTGALNPDIPAHLRQQGFYEPQNALIMGEAYKRALAINQKAANESGLNLFMSQWLEWDRIRKRFEPHESQFPGLGKMPAPSKQQLERALAAHVQTGHWDVSKKPGAAPEMKPTRPWLGNPSELGYLGVGGVAVGAGAMGGLADPRGYQQ